MEQIPQDKVKGGSAFAARFGRKAALRGAFSFMTGALLVFTLAVLPGLYPKSTLNSFLPGSQARAQTGNTDKKSLTPVPCCLDPNFQKGVSYTEWLRGTFMSSESGAMLEYIKNLHVSWVALVTTWYQERKNSVEIFRDEDMSHTDKEMIHVLKKIKSLGMHVMLKPHVDVKDGAWRGEIAFSDAERKAKWFASYEAFILHFAQMAEKNGVEVFCIGTELEQMTREKESAMPWDAMIKKIKSVYHGKLVYAANWTEYEQVPFWEELDFAGIDAYFPLSLTKNTSQKQLESSFEGVLNKIGKWQKKLNRPVIFTEIGFRSMDGTAVMPWNWEMKGAEDAEEQAMLYKIALEGVMKKSWMAGLYFWAVTPRDMTQHDDTGYTFYGKPAEQVLMQYYSPL